MPFFSHFSEDSWSFLLGNIVFRSQDLISISIENCEITPVSSVPVQEHRDHSRLPSLHLCMFVALWHGEPDLPGSSAYLLICTVFLYIL